MTKEDRKRERFNKPHIQETVRLAQNFDKDEWNAVLTLAESCGYGIYGYNVVEEDGKYYVWFERGSSCD